MKGWDASASAWIEFVERGDPNREILLDPVMLELCGDVSGQEVLDVGCGEGRFCRMLSDRGATVTGIDPTETLVRAARSRHAEGRYEIAFGEELPCQDESFDLVTCYVSLVDIKGYREAIREMARVLRPGGRVVIADLLSFRTALFDSWVRDENGNRLYVAIDRYFDERSHHADWREISIENWHRPTESILQSFLKEGLRLEEYREPKPNEEQIRLQPSMAYEARVPLFYAMRWSKR